MDIDKRNVDRLVAIDSSGHRVTYGELVEFCNDFTDIIPNRVPVLVLCRNDVQTFKIYMACMANRIVPLMISETTDANAISEFIKKYHFSHVFGYVDVMGRYDFLGNIRNLTDDGYCYCATELDIFPMYDELSLLLTTSGSTGSPKLVRHSYHNLTEQAKNISTFFETTENDRPMVDLPICYTMGLSIINSHIYKGATVLLSTKSIISKDFWKFFVDEEATCFTGVPYSFELLKRVKLESMDLHALNIMTQGGGKLNKDLQVKFANYISSKDGRYIATYGQTEGSARMAYLPAEYAVSKVGSIGKAIPNGKLYLLDENNSVIATPNTEGEMVYEGPNVTLGYAESGEDLIKGDERHGILRTGDLAYFDEDGFFYISGRMKRFLKLFGYRVNLDDCESLVRKEFGIGCACVGDDSRLVICIDKEGIEADVKSYIVHKTGLYATSVEVVYIGELPRSDAGKILYSEISKKVMG